jgi:hypothetical protein
MAASWRKYVIRRTTTVRTTWTFRAIVLAIVLAGLGATRGLWVAGVGRALVCDESLRQSDAILIDNFEVNYLVFERAEQLKSGGIARRVIVPTLASPGSSEPNRVFAGIAEVMSRVARLPPPELVPVSEIEPISLNASYEIRDYLRQHGIRSVVIVSPAFRSRRSALIYDDVLGAAGIEATCAPVFAPQQGPDTWTQTLHGIQEVAEQHVKLLYYRFYVMPFVHRRQS